MQKTNRLFAAILLAAAFLALVTIPGGAAASTGNFALNAAPAPTVTAFSPAKGSAGAAVTITGTNLTGATLVKFNGATAAFTVKSATKITAVVPSGATSGKISVTTPGGVATSTGSFTVTVLKVALSPADSQLQGNETDQFTATLTNAANTAVKWTATGGTISTTGLYRAGTTLGTFKVTATSVQDPTKGATAAVTIGATTTIAHPRIILNAATLSTLRARANANTAEWQNVKAVCDSFNGGTVLFPGQDNGYPDLPDIGEGYEGSGYHDALLPLGLCYYMTLQTEPATAAKYGAKAVQILMAMSNPQFFVLSGTPIWDRDDGYGIRYYGFIMGLGYDWFHSLLTEAQQAQIQTALDHWIYAFKNDESDNFEYVQPLGNYYAGYYISECLAGLAVEGDSTLGDAWYNDWYLNEHLKRIVPFYQQNMGGGGWPEGFADYGPLSAQNMSLPAIAVKTAKGIDLISPTNASQAYSYPLDEAKWIFHFTWPTLNFVDDRDSVLSNFQGDYQPGTGDPDSYTFFAKLCWPMGNDPLAPAFHRYARDAKAALAVVSPTPTTPDAWLEFLFWNDNAPEEAYSTQGMSHLAPGIGELAARSDWTTGATWMSFRSGPYVNNPEAGHQGYESGGLALVRGNNPLLVNPEGWLARNPNGDNGFTLYYNDWYGDFTPTDITIGNKRLFNTFQVRHLDSKGNPTDGYGQDQQARSDGARTSISGFEDAGTYVFAIGTHIEDMYEPFQTICSSDPSPVSSLSRQVVYLRPSRFIVYDRSTVCDASLDQYLAFHFPANPVKATAPAAGLLRYNVTTTSFAGSMTIIQPANATTTITDQLSSDTTEYNKVWRMEIRPSNAETVTRQWLTVFDLSPSASQVATATAVDIVSGAAAGALLQSAAGNQVVISGTARAGTAITGTLRYVVPAKQTQHVITDLTPSTGYTISVAVSGGNQTVSIVKGGSWENHSQRRSRIPDQCERTGNAVTQPRAT
jgi:hypothetical protein